MKHCGKAAGIAVGAALGIYAVMGPAQLSAVVAPQECAYADDLCEEFKVCWIPSPWGCIFEQTTYHYYDVFENDCYLTDSGAGCHW
jgi:hypothetical protein